MPFSRPFSNQVVLMLWLILTSVLVHSLILTPVHHIKTAEWV